MLENCWLKIVWLETFLWHVTYAANLWSLALFIIMVLGRWSKLIEQFCMTINNKCFLRFFEIACLSRNFFKKCGIFFNDSDDNVGRFDILQSNEKHHPTFPKSHKFLRHLQSIFWSLPHYQSSTELNLFSSYFSINWKNTLN